MFGRSKLVVALPMLLVIGFFVPQPVEAQVNWGDVFGGNKNRSNQNARQRNRDGDRQRPQNEGQRKWTDRDTRNVVEGIIGIGEGIIRANEGYYPDRPRPPYDRPPYDRPPYNRPPYYPSTGPTIIYRDRPTVVQPQPQPALVQPQPAPTTVNKVEMIPARIMVNATPFSAFAALTANQIDDEIDGRLSDIEDTKEELEDLVKDKAKQDVDNLVGYDAATKQKIKDRIEKGQAFGDLLTGADPAGEKKLGQHADALDAIADAADDAGKGKFDAGDAAKLSKVLEPYVQGDPKLEADISDALVGLAVDSSVIDVLDHARPGVVVIPVGFNTPIILVGTLPAGEVVSLGNGTVLIGTGNPDDGVLFGRGNAAQLAGLPVGIGEPIPDTDAKLVTDGVLLLNGGGVKIFYNVDNQQYEMMPGYRQHLPTGKTWKVEFDRGGTHGKQAYGLTEGTYKFTPTPDRGWELYKHTFNVTIDNSGNPVDFHYVLDNVQQTVLAGGQNQHTGVYPLIVRFDNGAGAEKKKRLEGGEYRIALSSDGSYNLYGEDDVAPPVKIADVIPSPGRKTTIFDDPRRVTSRIFDNQFTRADDRQRPNLQGSRSSHGSLFGR